MMRKVHRLLSMLVSMLTLLGTVWLFIILYHTTQTWDRDSDTMATQLTTVHFDDQSQSRVLLPEYAPVIPNIVHYIWFGLDTPMLFHHWLSVKSVYLRLKPHRILFHCDYEPTGSWWQDIKSLPTLEIVERAAPSVLLKRDITRSEHMVDVARMEILLEQGGIALDADVLVIKSFEPLRKYSFTMGLEYHGSPGRLNNGIILSVPNAEFLQIWYQTYTNFTKSEWDYHNSIIPYKLQKQYPHLIHVEDTSLNYPSGARLDLVYDKVYDWTHNYAIRQWSAVYDREPSPGSIRTMNSTFGEVARLIYYGNAKLLPPYKPKVSRH